jgi:hypothetical protein
MPAVRHPRYPFQPDLPESQEAVDPLEPPITRIRDGPAPLVFRADYSRVHSRVPNG